MLTGNDEAEFQSFSIFQMLCLRIKDLRSGWHFVDAMFKIEDLRSDHHFQVIKVLLVEQDLVLTQRRQR